MKVIEFTDKIPSCEGIYLYMEDERVVLLEVVEDNNACLRVIYPDETEMDLKIFWGKWSEEIKFKEVK